MTILLGKSNQVYYYYGNWIRTNSVKNSKALLLKTSVN